MSSRWGQAASNALGGAVRPPAIGIGLVMVAYLAEFYSVTTVAGGRGRLFAVVVAALVAATVLGRRLDVRRAFFLSVGLFAVGNVVYFLSTPVGYRIVFMPGMLARDLLSFLTGMSVLQVAAVDAWVASIAPVPTFLAWYLTVRGRYLDAVVVGGGTVGFFVLTGDAGLGTTLLGVVGAVVAVGCASLDAFGVLDRQWDSVALVAAAIVLLSFFADSDGSVDPLFVDSGPASVERTLVGEDDSLEVTGAVALDPEVRFVVESGRAARWRTDAYDRYTGDGWIRTGPKGDYGGPVDGPPGRSERNEQRVTARSPMTVLPAAWKPVEIDGGLASDARITPEGDFHPGRTIEEDERYAITSDVPTVTPEQLRQAGTDDPADVEDRYTQLPASTPDRVGALTEEVIEGSDADTRYDRALVVERYLQTTKDYSLSVDRPTGDIADAFLFEMDAGYCTYYATAMVAMLRSLDVPARFVTGYSTGERVAEDEYVVRGMNSHAWVEVYFPQQGWIEFDPTPSGPREGERRDRLLQAREAGEANVDTDRTEDDPFDTSPDDESDRIEEELNETVDEFPDDDPENETDSELEFEDDVTGASVEGEEAIPDPATFMDELGGPEGGTDAGGSSSRLPATETVGYGTALLVGLFAGAYRFGLGRRLSRGARMRIQLRTDDPAADVERAFERLEILLEKRYRKRRPGEAPRTYFETLSERGLDDRAYRVFEITERARYGNGDVSRAEADTAVALVDELVLEATPVTRRELLFLRRGRNG